MLWLRHGGHQSLLRFREIHRCFSYLAESHGLQLERLLRQSMLEFHIQLVQDLAGVIHR